MSATSEQIIEYYQNTLIAQYATKPKANATIGALMGGTGAYGLIAEAIYNQVRDGFDLATAQGKQLDLLGKFRGVDRYFNTLNLDKSFIQVMSYDDPDRGTAIGIPSYEDTQPPSWYTMTYDDFVENTLQDGDFRRVIMFLAALSSCDYTYGTLDAILYTFFAGNVNMIVSANMEITYQHLTSDTDNLFSIINQMGLLPSPAGVAVVVAEVGSF